MANIPSGSKYKINGVDIETYSNSEYSFLSTKNNSLDYLLYNNHNKPFPYVQKGDYYISTTGSDSNPGTYALPFATLNKALSVVTAGQTIFVRGGTYNMATNWYSSTYGSYVNAKVGTASNRYKLFGYPGERVIFDYSGINASGTRYGIAFVNCQYWYIKNIEFTRVLQYSTSTVRPFSLNNCNHMLMENCSFHDNQGAGTHMTGAYDDIEFRNCDGYNNYDPNTSGENSDGFAIGYNTNTSGTTRLINCRAWNNSDDGFDCWMNDGLIIFENCWAAHNGYIPETETSSGNGNGFKFGQTATSRSSTTIRIARNCLSFDNRQWGFNQNNCDGIIEIYNCTSFRNGLLGFWFFTYNNAHIIRNTISYKDPSNTFLSNTVHDHNTWDIPITVTDLDFISIVPEGLTSKRYLNEDFPTTGFLKLRKGSSLINAGVDVGLPYSGTAPDLGAYEYLEMSSSGVIPTDNIFDWDTTNKWYAPYSSKQASMSFYTGTTSPTLFTRLNIDANLYPTMVSIYRDGPAGSLINLNNTSASGYGIISSGKFGVYGVNPSGMTSGYGLFGTAYEVSSYALGASSLYSSLAKFSATGALSSSNRTTNLIEIIRDVNNGSATTVSGDIINIVDNPSGFTTVTGKILSATIGSTERISLNPRVVDGASAVAYTLDTHTSLVNNGAKLFSVKNGGTEYFSVGATGNINGNVFNGVQSVLTNLISAAPHLQLKNSTTILSNFYPTISDGASAVAYLFDTHNNLTTTGAKLASFKNQGVEKVYITKDGGINKVAGTSTTFVTVGGVLKDFYTDANTSGTSLTTLYTYDIPANTLVNDGDKIIFEVLASTLGSYHVDSNVTFSFGTTLVGANYTIMNTGQPIKCTLVIIRTSSSTCRVYSTYMGGNNNYTGYELLSSKNWTISNTLSFIALAGTGTITARTGYIEYKPAAIN